MRPGIWGFPTAVLFSIPVCSTGGKDAAAGQAALLARARANGAASSGHYEPGSEPSEDASLFVANYSY